MPNEFEIEGDERGFVLRVRATGGDLHYFAIADPEALYDTVKREIGPWLYERDMAQREHHAVGRNELGEYGLDDPKHPAFHSTHADIWDNREGK